MARATTYSMLNVTATLDGRAVVGHYEGDDAITVEPGADVGTLMVGAGGDTVFSQTADRSARITLNLQHTSPTHRELLRKWRRQSAGQITGFSFDIVEKRSNEGGTAENCYIMQAPTDSKGTNATVRTWVIAAALWKPRITNEVI